MKKSNQIVIGVEIGVGEEFLTEKDVRNVKLCASFLSVVLSSMPDYLKITFKPCEDDKED